MAADLLVLLDIVNFDRESLQHRCRLACNGESRWLTIPYRHIGEPQRLRSLEPLDHTWPKAHLARIREWYRGADAKRLQAIGDWYTTHGPTSDESLESVAIYAWKSMTYLVDICGLIAPPIILASALHPPAKGWGQKSDLVLNLCAAVFGGAGALGRPTYLSGVTGSKYLDYAAFERAGISIEVQAYAPPPHLPGRSQMELSALHTYLTDGPDAVRTAVAARR
jgi:hypothetical protein